jgi:hypothetical protein
MKWEVTYVEYGEITGGQAQIIDMEYRVTATGSSVPIMGSFYMANLTDDDGNPLPPVMQDIDAMKQMNQTQLLQIMHGAMGHEQVEAIMAASRYAGNLNKNRPKGGFIPQGVQRRGRPTPDYGDST